jgi:hypothetical protein
LGVPKGERRGEGFENESFFEKIEKIDSVRINEF